MQSRDQGEGWEATRAGVRPLSVLEGRLTLALNRLEETCKAATVSYCVLWFTSWFNYTYSGFCNPAVLLKATSPLQSLWETVNMQSLGTDWIMWNFFFKNNNNILELVFPVLLPKDETNLFFFFSATSHLNVAVHILQICEWEVGSKKKRKGKLQSGEGPCKSVPSAQCGPLLTVCTSNTMATAAISIIYLLFFLLGGSHYVAESFTLS